MTERQRRPWFSFSRSAAGGTVVELLVSMFITLSVLACVIDALISTSRRARDNEVISRAHEVARAVLDYMVFDIRLMGAGMPLGQNLFPIGPYLPASSMIIPPAIEWGDTLYPLGDAPWPLLPGSNANRIILRLNERGIETVLTSDFDPTASNTMSVLDMNDFAAGDIVYLYDRRKAGNAGLRGQITARSPASNNSSGRTPGTITINGNRNVSMAGTVPYVFAAGSSVNRVSTETYVSPSDNSGIQLAISDYDSTLKTLYPGTAFTLDYRDRVGAQINFPVSVTSVADVTTMFNQLVNLGSIVVTVTATGDSRLSDGTTYLATATQEVAIRNILLSYY